MHLGRKRHILGEMEFKSWFFVFVSVARGGREGILTCALIQLLRKCCVMDPIRRADREMNCGQEGVSDSGRHSCAPL